MDEPGAKLPLGSRTRRAALLIGAAGAIALAYGSAPWLRQVFAGDLEFVALESPPGFRRIAAGETSRGATPFAGLAPAGGGVASASLARLRADLCRALFGPGAIAPGVVPVASFSDYNCPYCRVLTAMLAELGDADDGLRIAWHEWPIFGKPSEDAAKAALAAGRQGAYRAFHARLMRSGFAPTPGYLRAVATEIGIDPERLLLDMESVEVGEDIADARGLAAIFGFIGTPALVVGRTVVVGSISEEMLRALIARERADGVPPVCAADQGG